MFSAVPVVLPIPQNFLIPYYRYRENKKKNHDQSRLSRGRPSVKTGLIIDDDIEAVYPLAVLFKNEGFNLSFVSNYRDGVESLNSQAFDVVVIDWLLGDCSASNLIKKVASMRNSCDAINKKPIKFLIFSAKEERFISIPNSKHFKKMGILNKCLDYDHLADQLREKLFIHGLLD